MRIKNLTEGLNAQQRSVPQLPAQARAKTISVLGAKTDPEHPFAGYAVGADEAAEPGHKVKSPDQNDPYEKGWRAGFRHNESNPYPAGSEKAAQWDKGYAEAEAQPDHYDEEVDLSEKLGALRPKLGTGHDVGKSVRKWRKQRGLSESDTQDKELGEAVAGKVEPIQELSSDALDRYKAKAKKSADDLTSQGKYRQANDRTMNVMKATGKQIDKTATNIRKALNRESVDQDMAEDDVADFLARGGKITQVKPNRGPRNPGLSLGSRHIGGGGDGARASRTGRGSRPQGKPVVAVESDVEEGLKSKLAGAVLAGAAAFGGGAQAQTAPVDSSNASVVQSLVNPVAQQRFAKMHADTTAKLTDPRYTHNPNAMAQHQAAPQQQHAEMLKNIKNIEQWDNPYRIIQMAMNMAGVTPQEVLQNLPKGYKLPTTEPKGTFVPKDLSKLNVKEAVTKEDIITKLKAKLGDYLSDIGQEIRKDPDLINKLAAKPAGNQMGPPVKTVTTDDGHEISIHGNEDDGFRISIKNRQTPSQFSNLDEAVMACEMYCARRRQQAVNADYVEEA